MIYSGVLYWAGMAIEAAEKTIQDSLDQFHNPKHSSTTCTAGTTTLSAFAAHFFFYLKERELQIIHV